MDEIGDLLPIESLGEVVLVAVVRPQGLSWSRQSIVSANRSQAHSIQATMQRLNTSRTKSSRSECVCNYSRSAIRSRLELDWLEPGVDEVGLGGNGDSS